jgi:hypothetical protein
VLHCVSLCLVLYVPHYIILSTYYKPNHQPK